MKRLFSLLIAITMSVSLFTALTACGPKKKNNNRICNERGLPH